MAKKRNYEARQSLAEAKGAKTLILKARKHESDIGLRVRGLKELAYSTFVSDVPGWIRHKLRKEGHDTRDVYRDPAVRERIRELGREGGEAYDNAVRTLKFTWDSRKSYEESLAILRPSK